VKIRNFVHKGLKRLYYDDEVKGLPAESVDKLRKMLAFLQEMGTADELQTIPVWKAHQLTGKRRGTWSLFVTRNWRLTFTVDRGENEICDVDYEDYH
jgi:proteic killer suppression protein